MSKRQIPHGPEDLKCPMWRKPMVEVCHVCPLWIQLRGKDPQTMQEIDRWNCSLAEVPGLLVENSQRQLQTAATVQELRNDVARNTSMAMNDGAWLSPPKVERKLIEQ